MNIDQQVIDLDSSARTVRKPSKPSSASLMRFAPPADCDIEQLLHWAYGKQQVHQRLRERERAGSSVSTGGRDSVITVQMNWIHGGRISGGGLPPGLPSMIEGSLDAEYIHPDAITIHNRVQALFGGTVEKKFEDADHLSIGLLINHGWLCNRPDWGGPLQPLEPKRNRKGQIEMERIKGSHPIASRLADEPREYNLGVLHMREVYQHWLGAMLLVRADLLDYGLLPHINIRLPTARVAPWQ